jgi:enamine deaminase RidA (YjgF/YER057c/UK114 family)
MTDTIESRLAEMGVKLPVPAAPAANYIPSVQSGRLLYTSGQIPMVDGKLERTGLLGRELDVAGGQASARSCAINVLAVVKAAVGDLARVSRVVKGASDFLVEALGERGRHARSAIGMASLPLDSPVEVEAIFEID